MGAGRAKTSCGRLRACGTHGCLARRILVRNQRVRRMIRLPRPPLISVESPTCVRRGTPTVAKASLGESSRVAPCLKETISRTRARIVRTFRRPQCSPRQQPQPIWPRVIVVETLRRAGGGEMTYTPGVFDKRDLWVETLHEHWPSS